MTPIARITPCAACTPMPLALRRGRQTGFIAGYILFGIAMLAVVTGGVAYMGRLSQQQTAQSERRQELINDALLVRQAILNCAQLYPNGNNADANSGYPEFPATGSGLVATLTCPGAPLSSATAPSVTIWEALYRSGSSSLPAPPRRRGLSEWRYTNQRDGTNRSVYFYVDSLATGDTSAAGLLQSLPNNWKLKPYFYAEQTTNSRGELVMRLRSKDLVSPN